jgi:hypothetical protein
VVRAQTFTDRAWGAWEAFLYVMRSPVTCKPFVTGGRVTMQQRTCNHLGARVRVAVEWKFGDLKQ